MLALLLRVTICFVLFINYGTCETDQVWPNSLDRRPPWLHASSVKETDKEFKDMILEKIAVQDEKIQKQEEKNFKQDEKIQQLESENAALKSKLDLHQSHFQETLDIAISKSEVTSLMSVPNSCFDLWQHGVTLSQTLVIDFDGKGRGSMPITVECDFSTNATKVGVAKTINFRNCDSNACDEQKIITNEKTLPLLLALINTSESCSQTIQFDCILAPLHVGLIHLCTYL
jgi:hypothetical protein